MQTRRPASTAAPRPGRIAPSTPGCAKSVKKNADFFFLASLARISIPRNRFEPPHRERSSPSCREQDAHGGVVHGSAGDEDGEDPSARGVGGRAADGSRAGGEGGLVLLDN